MRLPTRTRVFAALFGAVLAGSLELSTPASSRAYEGDATIELGVGYLAAPDAAGEHAIAGSVHATYGISNALTIRAVGAYGYAPGRGPAEAHRLIAAGELTYVLDILSVVPFFGIGVGASGVFTPNASRADFVLEGLAGLDWLVSRECLIGVDARAFLVVTNLERAPMQVLVELRVGVIL